MQIAGRYHAQPLGPARRRGRARHAAGGARSCGRRMGPGARAAAALRSRCLSPHGAAHTGGRQRQRTVGRLRPSLRRPAVSLRPAAPKLHEHTFRQCTAGCVRPVPHPSGDLPLRDLPLDRGDARDQGCGPVTRFVNCPNHRAPVASVATLPRDIERRKTFVPRLPFRAAPRCQLGYAGGAWIRISGRTSQWLHPLVIAKSGDTEIALLPAARQPPWIDYRRNRHRQTVTLQKLAESFSSIQLCRCSWRT